MGLRRFVGGLAIVLATFALAPSFLPGAMSLIGLSLAVAALILAVFSVGREEKTSFNITLAIVVFGVFVLNDSLRIVGALEMPLAFKSFLYALFVLVVAVCVFVANKRVH